MKDILETLLNEQGNLDKETFEEIFGGRVGSHIWKTRFSKNYNLLWLWGYLDKNNQQKLLNYLEERHYSNGLSNAM